jgi:polyisoprenoid-binding protein YceI
MLWNRSWVFRRSIPEFPLITAMMFATSVFALVSAVNWHVKGYSIKFSTSRAEGVIKGLGGTINFDEKNVAESSFNVTTLNTGSKTDMQKGRNSWMCPNIW